MKNKETKQYDNTWLKGAHIIYTDLPLPKELKETLLNNCNVIITNEDIPDPNNPKKTITSPRMAHLNKRYIQVTEKLIANPPHKKYHYPTKTFYTYSTKHTKITRTFNKELYKKDKQLYKQNIYQTKPNKYYTHENKTLHSLLWLPLYSEIASITFNFHKQHAYQKITQDQTILDLIKYALNHNITVQIKDHYLNEEHTFDPVAKQYTSGYSWTNLNQQLKPYIKSCNRNKPNPLDTLIKYQDYKYLSHCTRKKQDPETYYETITQTLNTWAPAYEIQPDTTLKYQSTIDYNSIQTYLEDPKHYLNNEYSPADFYEYLDTITTLPQLYTLLELTITPDSTQQPLSQPITNPHMIICETCNLPMSTLDSTPSKGNTAFYGEYNENAYTYTQAHLATCSHCGTDYIHDPETDTYLPTSNMEDLTYTPKLSGNTYTWKNETLPRQPITTHYPTNHELVLELLTAYQELYPNYTIQQLKNATSLHYYTLQNN
jgi:hypothetical protein